MKRMHAGNVRWSIKTQCCKIYHSHITPLHHSTWIMNAFYIHICVQNPFAQQRNNSGSRQRFFLISHPALAGLPALNSCTVNKYISPNQYITANFTFPHTTLPTVIQLISAQKKKNSKSTIYFAITHYSNGALTNTKINCSELMNHPLLIPQMRLFAAK